MNTVQTILLIDDDDTTNFLHKRLIQRLNIAHKTVIAGNGEEGLQYLQQSANDPEASFPDLIFLDIKMPVMDGFEFLAEYEKLAEAHALNIPVFMLTTSVNPSDIERIKKFPTVIEYFHKPLTELKLKQIVAFITNTKS